MKPETARGIRRTVPRRRRARGRTEFRAEAARADLHADSPDDGFVGTVASGTALDEDADWGAELADFDPAEFAEFLEADDATLPADPGFRERLRSQLWSMVRERADAVRPRGIGAEGRSRTPTPDPKPRR